MLQVQPITLTDDNERHIPIPVGGKVLNLTLWRGEVTLWVAGDWTGQMQDVIARFTHNYQVYADMPYDDVVRWDYAGSLVINDGLSVLHLWLGFEDRDC